MSNTKDALKVQALTQRIAVLVAQYEEQLADLRAQSTILVEALNERIADLEKEAAYGQLALDTTDED